MATSRGQRPRKSFGNGIRPEGGGGNHAISSAPSGAHSVADGIPGALPPASRRRPFGPKIMGVYLIRFMPMGRRPGCRVKERDKALKGHAKVVPPFQGFVLDARSSQGVALGWHVAGLLALIFPRCQRPEYFRTR